MCEILVLYSLGQELVSLYTAQSPESSVSDMHFVLLSKQEKKTLTTLALNSLMFQCIIQSVILKHDLQETYCELFNNYSETNRKDT